MRDLRVILLSPFDLPENKHGGGGAILFRVVNQTYIYARTIDCVAF